jgi:hypothetical protein
MKLHHQEIVEQMILIDIIRDLHVTNRKIFHFKIRMGNCITYQ